MALTARHRWCIERIKDCFHEEGVEDSVVQGFVHKSQVIKKFNSLFSGEGRNVLFVHYQQPKQDSFDQNTNPELFLSFGDSVPLISKVRKWLNRNLIRLSLFLSNFNKV